MADDPKEAMARVGRESDMAGVDTVLRAAVLAGEGSSLAAVRYMGRHGSASWRPGWGAAAGEQLREAAAKRASSIRVAARKVQAGFLAGPALFQGRAVAGVLGGLGAGHGLACDLGDYLADQYEPQITYALAEALHAKGGPVRWIRVRTFLQALGVEGLLESLDHWQETPEKVVVQAEDPAGARRRMDLRISWPGSKSEEHHGVIIEAKFGHEVTEGQLPAYENRAKVLFDRDCMELILLTGTGAEQAEEGRYRWRPVSWLQLLRRWEELLPDAPGGLALVKRLIWMKGSRK